MGRMGVKGEDVAGSMGCKTREGLQYRPTPDEVVCVISKCGIAYKPFINS